MKIITDSNRKYCYFKDVEQGQVFLYDDRYAMAIDDIYGINTVFLDDGSVKRINDHETVTIGFDAALIAN